MSQRCFYGKIAEGDKIETERLDPKHNIFWHIGSCLFFAVLCGWIFLFFAGACPVRCCVCMVLFSGAMESVGQKAGLPAAVGQCGVPGGACIGRCVYRLFDCPAGAADA